MARTIYSRYLSCQGTQDPGKAVTQKISQLPLASRFRRDQDEVSYNRNNDGDGCILVARGDYDGDHKQDVALILTKKKGDGTLLIAALRRSEEWDIAELPSWCGPIGRCFVMSSRPGTYKMTESFDYTTLHPDSREEMTTTTEVIYSGKTESSGITYGLIGKIWVHVWVSD